MEAQPYCDGAIVETFRNSHCTNGHSVGLIKAGTCSILNSNARVLADQMAEWVKRRRWTLGLED